MPADSSELAAPAPAPAAAAAAGDALQRMRPTAYSHGEIGKKINFSLACRSRPSETSAMEQPHPPRLPTGRIVRSARTRTNLWEGPPLREFPLCPPPPPYNGAGHPPVREFPECPPPSPLQWTGTGPRGGEVRGWGDVSLLYYYMSQRTAKWGSTSVRALHSPAERKKHIAAKPTEFRSIPTERFLPPKHHTRSARVGKSTFLAFPRLLPHRDFPSTVQNTNKSTHPALSQILLNSLPSVQKTHKST